jgi:Tfp pilus assembly protein PilO
VQVKTKNLAVIALAALLVVTLWYRTLYSSYQAQADKSGQAAENAEQRAATIERQVRKLEGEQDDKTRADATDELNRAIPVTPELADFLRTTDKIRSDSGVAFQSITPSAPTLVGGVQTINIGINVQGEYGKVVRYLDALIVMPRLVVIDSVGFSASGSSGASASSGGGPTGEVFAGTGSAPTLQAQVTARLFSQAPAAGATSAAGSGDSASTAGPSSARGNGTQQNGPTALPPEVN